MSEKAVIGVRDVYKPGNERVHNDRLSGAARNFYHEPNEDGIRKRFMSCAHLIPDPKNTKAAKPRYRKIMQGGSLLPRL